MLCQTLSASRGSSPHSQGTACQTGGVFRRRGIIPALAGNRDLPPCAPFFNTDHPRTRREQDDRRGIDRPRLGSSPHSQGTVLQQLLPQLRLRIIPALAGNSCGWSWREDTSRDHPRTRREQAVDFFHWYPVDGSSPHSQGTDENNNRSASKVRIIPALAGNRVPSSRSSRPDSDHPRTRREQNVYASQAKEQHGSSPHSQGTVRVAGSRHGYYGIIPALAGNRLLSPPLSLPARDHPRTRREQRVCRVPGEVV